MAVQGMVRLDGQPLADVEVQFVPDPSQGTHGPPASAYTDAEGRYRIDVVPRSGVVVGNHRVVINDARAMMPGGGMDPDSGEAQPGAGPKAAPRARFPRIYSDLNRTPFASITVTQPNQTVDLDLKRQPQ